MDNFYVLETKVFQLMYIHKPPEFKEVNHIVTLFKWFKNGFIFTRNN